MGEVVVSLKLDRRLQEMARDLAARQGEPLEEFLQSALATHIANLGDRARFEERRLRGDPAKGLAALRKMGTGDAVPGDELPPGWREGR